MRILPTTDEAIFEQCARLVSESEPFVTLLFDYEKAKEMFRGDYKETYVVMDGEKVAGFVTLQLYGLMRGYIQTICLFPEYRNKGLGTELLNFSVDRLSKEFANVFMCVSSFNHKAQALYERLGFERVGVLTNHIVRGHDEYILRKNSVPIREFRKVV